MTGGQSTPDQERLLELVQAAELIAGAAEPDESGTAVERLEHALLLLRTQRDESAQEQRRAEQALYRLESTLRALRAASRVAENVASAFEREKVLAAIPDALIKIFGAATARVWLIGPGDRCNGCAQAARCADKTSCFHLVEYGARGPLDLALARVPIGAYSVGRVGLLGKVISSNDLASDPGLADPDWARVEGIRSFAGQPLFHEGRLLGAVAMWSRAPIREEMLEALRLLAHHAATAIAGARLLETVRAESARAQLAVTRLSALLDAERSGVVLLDGDDRIAYVNGTFRRLFGLDSRPLIGKARAEIEALLAPVLETKSGARPPIVLLAPDASDADSAAAAPSDPGEFELQIQSADDPSPRTLQRYTAKVRSPSGTVHGWMAVFGDVTAAREVDRMKSEFISTVSHELRTPLTSIKGALALLLEGEPPLDGETSELLRVAARNSDRLMRLVSDILDLSTLEAGKLVLRPSSLSPASLCAQAAEEIAGIAQQQDVAIRVVAPEDLPRVRGDADRILQVLSNLLSNALKFSPHGGTVMLRAAPGAGDVRFVVEDQGPGVPPDFLSKLFTRFAQSERARHEQAGTGLGLAICQALVRRQGGVIGCDSPPGKGATFFFTLPLAESNLESSP